MEEREEGGKEGEGGGGRCRGAGGVREVGGGRYGGEGGGRVFLLLSLLAPVAVLSQFYLPQDCDDIYQHDNTKPSGVYTIYPGGPITPLHVYCDMDTDGGRWTVFQRRMDGTENFYRPWAHYKSGFGNVAGEYWLGLDNIFLLTMRKKSELRVDMEDFEGGKQRMKLAPTKTRTPGGACPGATWVDSGTVPVFMPTLTPCMPHIRQLLSLMCMFLGLDNIFLLMTRESSELREDMREGRFTTPPSPLIQRTTDTH
ncbi:unnamed protein product [Coregonus sp. 'balchen']|nr:unnamed protein product [Coregonus sp. 'balchen']